MLKKRKMMINEEIKIGHEYYFFIKGIGEYKKVTIVNKGYIDNDGNLVKSIGYILSENGNKTIYNVDKEVFLSNYMPIELSKGDEIVAISMGKIIGKYKIEMVDLNSSIATVSECGRNIKFESSIESNERLVLLADNINDGINCVVYYFISKRRERTLAIQERISDCLSCLGEINDAFNLDALDMNKLQYSSLSGLYEKCMELKVEVNKTLGNNE